MPRNLPCLDKQGKRKSEDALFNEQWPHARIEGGYLYYYKPAGKLYHCKRELLQGDGKRQARSLVVRGAFLKNPE